MEKEQKLSNALRIIAVDATYRANSGHPGMPMGMADIATILWTKHLQFNPKNPHFDNRDRFILSNGHGSMLHYALLHLAGFELSMEEIKNFRQLNSKTPGHPEANVTPGIETSTGPLGQGLANGVGMAIAENHLASIFNTKDFNIVDHYTYVFVGDGCLMEGISHEAASLAGTLGLSKLIVFYDDNNVSIDGNIDGWFTDDTAQRFNAYNWQVIDNVDGHNFREIDKAIQSAKQNSKQPSLIKVKTTIGFGSPNFAGSSKTHGAPFAEDEIAAIRSQLDWRYEPFEVPDDVYSGFDNTDKGNKLEQEWLDTFSNYQSKYPEKAKEYKRRISGALPDNWHDITNILLDSSNKNCEAGRNSSNYCIEILSQYLPELFGGSADLTSSNMTRWSKAQNFSKTNGAGTYLDYGVREFAMSAIVNGLAIHGGILPFAGTFLTFSDYARNAVRMAAMMEQREIFVYSHESIGLGEDGPTHQPIEHTASLRLIPNLNVWRPCDSTETIISWIASIEYQGPSALLVSKHPLEYNQREPSQIENIKKGGYILHDCQNPELIIIATGYEVSLAIKATKELPDSKIRVVSMPSVDVFKQQTAEYQQSVLPDTVKKRIAIEAGSTACWYEFVGISGKIIGVDSFGKSAPYKDIYNYFEITVDNIVNTVLSMQKN